MKKQFLVFALMLSAFISQAQVDSVIILIPGAGMNDSSDQGGTNGGKDVFANQGEANTNYAANTWLQVTPVSTCNPTHELGFIQFDISTLPEVVDSVFVGFTHYPHTSYCLSNCNADFYFARITQPWYEQEVTYNNYPAFDTAFYGPINITFPNDFGTREYNITHMYRNWKSGLVPNYGFGIYSTTSGCNNAAVGFYTHTSDDTDQAVRPYLKVHITADTSHPNRIVTVKGDPVSVQLYPNPGHNTSYLVFGKGLSVPVMVTLTDIAGREVLHRELAAVRGDDKVELDISALTPGLYVCRIVTSQGTAPMKLLKQ